MSFRDELFASLMNHALYEELYKTYCTKPEALEPHWLQFFKQLESKEPEEAPRKPASSLISSCQIRHLIDEFRRNGHFFAKTVPVGASKKPPIQELTLKNLGFSGDDENRLVPSFGLSDKEEIPLKELYTFLQETYANRVGIEYMECRNPSLQKWIQDKIEKKHFSLPLTIQEKYSILESLNKASLFEWFLQTKYVGQKRFSLEGGETFIPILQTLLHAGTESGTTEFIISMAHRGRLNVLSNIFGKSYSDIFSEFEEHYIPASNEGSGDVKYHKGYESNVETTSNKTVKVTLSPNPSHLESVDPVVLGRVRALQTLHNDLEKQEKIIPILVHGDAALAGQGIVYETMQFGKLQGYSVGGTIHIVINNHIGFTTVPTDFCSSFYCTDIAKAFDAPVFHVNAEDPETCVRVAKLAMEIRNTFHIDVFIDMNCYRKYGHNESDEPNFTQPLEYQIIRSKKSIREIYSGQLQQEGHVEQSVAEKLEVKFKNKLQEELKKSKDLPPQPSPALAMKTQDPHPDFFTTMQTEVSCEKLQKLATQFSKIPTHLEVHPKLVELIKHRLEMVVIGGNDHPLDWGMAELLAYATLLDEGYPIRLSGQDCMRGTFSHRHAVWVDQKNESSYYPLQHLSATQAPFHVYNSSLSEFGVLGFEYGYSVGYPESLVIWEAQFGDFCNSAQVIIDQYITTAEKKWGQKSNLVLYLPHGYEGQGPEHSSGRMERFLLLSGSDNMIIVNPTTPAQFFHLLRRHLHSSLKKPLIIFTPKVLLRHPDCTSDIQELVRGHFHEIIPDQPQFNKASQVIICSGKIYYDLVNRRKIHAANHVSIIRIEQLYPLSMNMLQNVLSTYTNAKDIIWAQEEPSNMGAWNFIRPKLQKLLAHDQTLSYVGRERSSSPATGSHRIHKEELDMILKTLFPGGEAFNVPINLMQKV